MEPTFFDSPEAFRAWLEAHHTTERELWIGFHQQSSGNAGLSYLSAVDEALCFGWTDGPRKSIDGATYKIRFIPRKPRSQWSAVNVHRADQLIRLSLMRPAGLAAFARRKPAPAH
ncbi:MAG TPA: hypothetical protein VF807_10850 [Ktedonobacterales bacterium]